MLKTSEIGRAQGVCLGNHRYQVDSRAETFHDFDIERLQSMSGGSDEIEAGMDTQVDLIDPSRLLLLEHVGFMLVIEEFDDWHPRIAVVNIIAESRCIDNCQADCAGVRA